MQQKSVYLSSLRFKSFIFSILHMSNFIIDDRLNPPLHGKYLWHTFLERCSAILQRQFFSAALCFPKSVLLDSSQATYLVRSQFKKKILQKLLREFGNVLWIVIMLEYYSSAKLLETSSHLVNQYFGISTGLHLLHYASPYHHTPTSVLPCWDYAFTVVVLAMLTPNMLDPIRAEQIWSHLTKDCAPQTFIKLLFMFFSKV